jgi:hypothetical protein
VIRWYSATGILPSSFGVRAASAAVTLGAAPGVAGAEAGEPEVELPEVPGVSVTEAAPGVAALAVSGVELPPFLLVQANRKALESNTTPVNAD